MKYKIIAYEQHFLTIERGKRTTKKPYFIELYTIHGIDFKDVSKKEIQLHKEQPNLLFESIRESVPNSEGIYAWHNSKLGKYRQLVGV